MPSGWAPIAGLNWRSCRSSVCRSARRKKRSTPRWKKRRQAIRARIPKGAAVVAMCVEGRLLSSEALARQLAGYAAGGTSKVCFLVGGSFGLDEGLKREASLRLSMSPMTFPHHLARVMLAEQIYRACTINAGTQYHK